jgi:hypothetical protein
MPDIIVKRRLIIFRRPGDWSAIYSKIMAEFGMGMAVRTRMRRELGFSYRIHRGLVNNEYSIEGGPSMHYEEQVHVDFYNEAAQSWFQLKYLNL